MSSNNQHFPEQETGVEEVVNRSTHFLEEHFSKILIGVAVILLAVGGYYAYKAFIAGPKAEKAANALYVAEAQFIDGQDSLALNGNGMASKGLTAIAKEYSGTDAGNVAQAYRGICLYDAGKYKEALEALKDFSSSDAYIAPSIKRLVGDCYAQLGQLEEAAKAYEAAAKAASNDAISPSCLIKAGHVYEKLGKKDQALKLYQEVKDKYITSPEAQIVEVDIQRASSK